MAVVELPATEQLHGGGDLEGVEGSTACAALQLGSSLPQNLVKDGFIQPCWSSLCVKEFTFLLT